MALPTYQQGPSGYGPGAIQRRLDPSGTNQFSPPGVTGGPDAPPNFYPIPADNTGDARGRLYDPTYGGPMVNPYSEVGVRHNNNPYGGAEVNPNPYGNLAVSPTGEVTGVTPQAPVPTVYGGQEAGSTNPSGGAGPTTSRNNQRRDQGNGQSNNQRDPGNEPRQNPGNTNPDNNNGGGNNNGGNNNGGNNNNSGNNNAGSQNPANDPNMRDQTMQQFMKGFYKNYSDDEKKWLSTDSTLSDMLRNLVASQGDFASQYNTATGNIADTFRRQIGDIKREKGTAMTGLDDAMASSGMMRSSGYGTELGNLQADFARQAFDARMAKTTGMADQFAERQNFMRQLEIAKTQARADALRRLAAEQMDIGGMIG